MENKTAGVIIKGFVRLKPKMYSFFVDDSSNHQKKAKSVNKIVVAKINYNEHKDLDSKEIS